MELNDVLAMEFHSFFDYVKTIRYGYLDSSGRLHFADEPDFTVADYVFSSPEEVVRNNCGWCWDVANLIAHYCAHHGIDHRTVFMEYHTPELHQTHTQVFLKLHNLWYPAPDNSSPDAFGTGSAEDFMECLERFADPFRAYLRCVLQDRYDGAQLLLRTAEKPVPPHISDEDYLKLMRN